MRSRSSDATTREAPRWMAAPGPAPGERVLVGLSGGVDSAVAALRLVESGLEVVGVTTRNFCFDGGRFDAALSARSCCSQDAIDAARELCATLDLSHSVLDVADRFEREVIDDAVSEYRAGRTPNPCVRCNTRVRFPRLLSMADQLGIRWVATGHYARRLRHAAGSVHVAVGRDPGKDQSYFLYGLLPWMLERIHFPLGDSTKEEVRDHARRAGLPSADAPESQELCFVPDGDRRSLLGGERRSGDIVDGEGNVLGRHDGVEFFTPGQRRGLGLGGGPWFVRELRAARGQVVVGREDDLLAHRLRAHCPTLRDPEEGRPGLRLRTRSRHAGIPLASLRREGEHLELELEQPDRAPAPGQAAVIYRDEAVVGGGPIVSASRS